MDIRRTLGDLVGRPAATIKTSRIATAKQIPVEQAVTRGILRAILILVALGCIVWWILVVLANG